MSKKLAQTMKDINNWRGYPVPKSWTLIASKPIHDWCIAPWEHARSARCTPIFFSDEPIGFFDGPPMASFDIMKSVYNIITDRKIDQKIRKDRM
jgi:hypothetical protein